MTAISGLRPGGLECHPGQVLSLSKDATREPVKTMALCTISDPPQLNQLGDCFSGIIKIFVAMAGVVVVITFLIGAFKYVISRGDKAGLESAQSTITYALIGLVIVALSFGIITLIDRSLLGGTGVLLNFEIPTI